MVKAGHVGVLVEIGGDVFDKNVVLASLYVEHLGVIRRLLHHFIRMLFIRCDFD